MEIVTFFTAAFGRPRFISEPPIILVMLKGTRKGMTVHAQPADLKHLMDLFEEIFGRFVLFKLPEEK